jgi:DNA invertase Pin-like site-specific DNA recombinase
MIWKYCILAAVSTEEQAKTKAGEDKESLDHQEAVSRIWGDKHGGTYVDTYRAEGFSRTGWYDFTRALATSKDFMRLANDARTHKFDVILMESFDRLGDLAVMWFTYLEREIGPPYIQLRSTTKPLIIEDPETYDPRYDESTPDALNDAQKINRYRVNKLRRAGAVGIPQRAKSGRYALQHPYGYIDTSTKDEYRLELDPVVAHLLQQLAAEYLKGASLDDCARAANASGVPSPRGAKWHRSRISYIFGNPFYAGKTFYGRTVREVELYDGKHAAMWDIETHEKLIQEMERRGANLKNAHHYPLSDVIHCKNCKEQMYITRCLSRDKKSYYFYYRCINKHCTQRAAIRMEQAHEKTVDAVTKAILQAPDITTQPPAPVDNSKALAALERQDAKLKDAYETTDRYSKEEFVEKSTKIQHQIDELKDEELQRQKSIQHTMDIHNARMEARQMLPELDNYIQTGPAKHVSNWLGKFCVIYCDDKKHLEVVLIE